jgi:hypothetical protein
MEIKFHTQVKMDIENIKEALLKSISILINSNTQEIVNEKYDRIYMHRTRTFIDRIQFISRITAMLLMQYYPPFFSFLKCNTLMFLR